MRDRCFSKYRCGSVATPPSYTLYPIPYTLYPVPHPHIGPPIERCIPSEPLYQGVENRACSFLCKRAMKEIADIEENTGGIQSGNDVTHDRTTFAEDWIKNVEKVVAFRTGGIRDSTTKDIHRVMFSCMTKELKRYECYGAMVRAMACPREEDSVPSVRPPRRRPMTTRNGMVVPRRGGERQRLVQRQHHKRYYKVQREVQHET
jgi:hypothetical protein